MGLDVGFWMRSDGIRGDVRGFYDSSGILGVIV